MINCSTQAYHFSSGKLPGGNTILLALFTATVNAKSAILSCYHPGSHVLLIWAFSLNFLAIGEIKADEVLRDQLTFKTIMRPDESHARMPYTSVSHPLIIPSLQDSMPGETSGFEEELLLNDQLNFNVSLDQVSLIKLASFKPSLSPFF